MCIIIVLLQFLVNMTEVSLWCSWKDDRDGHLYPNYRHWMTQQWFGQCDQCFFWVICQKGFSSWLLLYDVESTL